MVSESRKTIYASDSTCDKVPVVDGYFLDSTGTGKALQEKRRQVLSKKPTNIVILTTIQILSPRIGLHEYGLYTLFSLYCL